MTAPITFKKGDWVRFLGWPDCYQVEDTREENGKQLCYFTRGGLDKGWGQMLEDDSTPHIWIESSMLRQADIHVGINETRAGIERLLKPGSPIAKALIKAEPSAKQFIEEMRPHYGIEEPFAPFVGAADHGFEITVTHGDSYSIGAGMLVMPEGTSKKEIIEALTKKLGDLCLEANLDNIYPDQ